MTALQIPGIYQETLLPTTKPALHTGVPVFIGRDDALKPNDVGLPQPLRQFDEPAAIWAADDSHSHLKEAVRGFFGNGGAFCYVLAMAELNLESLGHALEIIDSLEDIDLVCAPDLVLAPSRDLLIALQRRVLDHCDRRGDRFAILDGGQTLSDLEQQRQRLKSPNGALYFPWLQVEAPGQADSRKVPPCGHLAGIYARLDHQGRYKAPANEVIEGAVSLGISLSIAQQSSFYRQQDQGAVNLIRALPGRGIRVWGAYTLSRDRRWRYINVRRLVLTVKRWVELNLAQVAFEPNIPELWSAIKRDLGEYLNQLFQAGALQGASPEEAFYVKCDAETNSESVRSQGQVVTEIGLAPLEPSEFIRVTLVQSLGGGTDAVIR